MSITFYFAPQSNASRVHGSLIELGVPFEKVRVDIRIGEQKKPEFLALNPNGKVPTVVLDGTPMFESVAIQIALGERYGVERGLWPAPGTPERLRALTWLVWGQVSLGAAIGRYLNNTSAYVPAAMHHAGQAAAALKETRGLLDVLDARLAESPYLAGEAFTLADLDVSAVLNWGFWASKIDGAAWPHIAAWRERNNARPAFQAVMAAER